MNIHFEFLSQLREKAGTEQFILFLPTGPNQVHPTILLALKEMEMHFVEKGIRVLEGERIRKGVMLFVKTPSGGLTRILDPRDLELKDQQTIVLANAMEGG